MFDLIVVGGGPAGSAAAITAVRGGARVLLLERGRLPRHKVCGEFVSAESLELLGSLLHGQHLAVLNDAARISRTRLYVDGRMIGAVVDPPAASIARFDLDAALWESAQLAGADVIGLPHFELLAMLRHQLAKQIGIGRIILGPAGSERFAITR